MKVRTLCQPLLRQLKQESSLSDSLAEYRAGIRGHAPDAQAIETLNLETIGITMGADTNAVQ